MSREIVYFTLYEMEGMRSKSLAEAEARCLPGVPHRFVRIEVVDDGDGAEIRSAQFIDAEELAREAASKAAVLETMRADMNGEIEG